MKMETKRLPIESVELKATETGYSFSGYASKFNLIDAYGDTIQPGAYKNTIKKRERPIRLRWQHSGPVIGKWLKVIEDEKGLYVEGELTPGHSDAENVYALLKHGAIDGLSIGYRVKAYEQTDEDTRLLKEIELVEISVVEEPADLGATVESVKSDIEQCESLKDFETILRDAGRFSKGDATALVSRIKSFVLRDSEQENQKLALKNMFEQFNPASTEKE